MPILTDILMDAEENCHSPLLCELKQVIMQENINVFDLAVVTPGYGVEEFRPQWANPCNDGYSIAKVFTMTAVGMLIDAGKLRLDQKIYPLFTDCFPKDFDDKWRSVTVADVLAHKIGIAADPLDIDNNLVQAEEFLTILFSLPIPGTPGETWNYSDTAYYLLSRLVKRVDGRNIDAVLRPMFTYMGIQEVAWSQDTQCHPIGATGLYMRAKDMVKLAVTYLQGGVYEGRRFFSEEWASTVLQQGYELKQMRPGIFAKRGMRGQMLLLCPAAQTAIAWHGWMLDESYRRLEKAVFERLTAVMAPDAK